MFAYKLQIVAVNSTGERIFAIFIICLYMVLEKMVPLEKFTAFLNLTFKVGLLSLPVRPTWLYYLVFPFVILEEQYWLRVVVC